MWRRRRHDPQLTRELQEEVQTHLDMRTDELMRRGLPAASARRAAEARLGPIAPILEESARVRRRGRAIRRALVADVRHTVTGIRRAPASTSLAVGVAAVGLGTMLAALTVADALLIRPPAGVVRAHELHSVLDSYRQDRPTMLSYATVSAIARTPAVEDFFAWGEREVQIRRGTESATLTSALVSGTYFRVLGVRPAVGRLLGDDDAMRANRVVVLSALAARRLDAQPGTALLVNGQPFDVAGIAASSFRGVDATHPVDVWLPVETEPLIAKTSVFPDGRTVKGYIGAEIGWMWGGVRIRRTDLRPSVEAAVTSTVRLLRSDLPERRAIVQPRIWIPPFSGNREQLETVVQPLVSLGLLILLLTAATLGSLFVARIAIRQRDFTIRLALGASRRRLLQLTAMEMGLIAIAGAVLGGVAYAGLLQAVSHLQLLPGIVVADAVRDLDLRTLGILAVLACVTFLFAAVGPLVFVCRMKGTMLDGARLTAPGGRWRTAMMTLQVGAAGALLVGAFLLTQSLRALRAQPIGFDAADVTFVQTDPGTAGLSDAERVALAARILRERVTSPLAIADEAPFRGNAALIASGDGAVNPKPVAVPATRVAGPYFETLGVPFVAGRNFDDRDRGRRVTIISQPLADGWWPKQSAVGRVIRVGATSYEVIGVVTGIRDLSLRARPTARLYLPFSDETEALFVFMRSGEARRQVALRQLIESLDPRVAVTSSGTLDQLMTRTIEQRLLLRAFTAVVGGGSLLLVVAGVWGLSHSNLVRRWREIGIRQALGAPRRATVLFTYRDACVVAVAGGLLGVAGGYQFGQLMTSLLFQVQPADVRTLAAAAGLVMFTALAGALIPARQALRYDLPQLLRSAD